jgi:EAL domain-containing protein (putative c-di-GMP-specific phosphodiesterase class I)
MWNFSFAIPSLLILGLLLLFYFSLPRLHIRMNRAFLSILVVESLVIIVDILSSWADSNIAGIPLFVVHLLNVLYFVLFFLRSGVTFFYTASVLRVLHIDRIRQAVLLYIPALLCIIASILSPVFGFIYYIEDNQYHSGPFYISLYYCFWFYLLASYICWFKFSSSLRRNRERYGLLFYIMILTAGIIVRQIFPHILLMDTFCIMAVLVVYLVFENPEFYLERRGNVFNSTAFRDFIEENNGTLSYNILGMVIHNYNDMRDIYGGRQMDEGITMISEYFAATYPYFNIFYHRSGRFMVMCPKSTDMMEVILNLSDRFKAPWKSETADLYLDVGFALMDIGETVSSSEMILSSLISALDDADSGRSREVVMIDRQGIDQTMKDTEIKKLLDHAIENDLIEVYLQPLFSTRTGKIIGAEALSRLVDNDGKLVPPKAFIGIAERNGKIIEMGEQVFEKTCRFIKQHNLLEHGIEWINVNLSPIQFLRADLAERFSGIAAEYGVDTGMVHLEITEESMIDDAFLQKQMASMTDRGFKFALDDYGTGYSNLNRLKRCPFSNIKLDMSVVWDYYKTPDEILPTMIKAFKQMNFEITAEGIEDELMAEAMKKIGCDYLQGYYYSKPIPMAEYASRYLN